MNCRIIDKHGRVKRRETHHRALRDYGVAHAANSVKITAHGDGRATVRVDYSDGATGTADNLPIEEASSYVLGRKGFPHAVISAELRGE